MTRLSPLDREAVKLCGLAFLLFWALPLAGGTWLLRGFNLHFTLADAAILTFAVFYFSREMWVSARKLLRAL